MQHACRPFIGFNHAARILILLVWILTGWKGGSIPLAAAAAPTAPKAQWSDLNLYGPPGSGQFGKSVYPLPNGNLVVVDPSFSDGDISLVGAVYLYDSAHTLVHRLTGSQANDQVGYYGVKVLANSSYLVLSPYWDRGGIADAGAATWCSGITGCAGEVVSADSSLVGSAVGERLGTHIKVLRTGNYVISSENSVTGTVTWCNGASGCFGEASLANSQVGNHSIVTVTELGDGDYVVSRQGWRNDANLSVGAVTWCSGTAGCTGTVSASNSLVGSQSGDYIGWSVSALADDDFVVISPDWANGAAKSAGAVTWCSGTTGCAGVVSSSNSQVGSQANDRVGSEMIVPLVHGNYVVVSPEWANGSYAAAGAVTWCRGDGSCVGTVLANQSLVGVRSNDHVGHWGVQGLTNGNYVTLSTLVRNANTTDRVTFCNGTSGCSGTIDTGAFLEYIYPNNSSSITMSVTPLDDGNYVVSTQSWWNGSTPYAGAATWCSGQTGCAGSVSASNSLIGSHRYDQVGEKIYPLPGGRYVVNTNGWANGANQAAGAVTFCNGSSGCTGVVSEQNSLVGEHDSDAIGSNLVVLTNGNYVVSSSSWDNGSATNRGQVTWCSGKTGCTGTVLSNRSLIGGQASSSIGGEPPVALSNGNYVANDYQWSTGTRLSIGVATWCPGDTGCAGIVSDQNSLTGTQTHDSVSSIIKPLASGNYLMIHNTWSNGSTVSSGAVTLGAGNAPVPVGPVSSENSLLGTIINGGNSLTSAFDAVNGLLVVGKPKENQVSFLNIPSTTIASGAWDDPKTWDYGVPAPNGEAIISAEHHVTVSGVIPVRKVTIQTGGKLELAAGSSLAVHGQFDNQGDFEGLAGTVIVAGPGEVGLIADSPTAFGNLTIESGAVLVEQPLEDFFSIVGRLDNQGVIRKSQPVGGTGQMSFGLTGVTVDVTGIGGLQRIQVDRIDQNHPHAGDGRYRLISGTYFSLSTTPTDSQDYEVGLYLPIAEANERTEVCRYSGAGWDCAHSRTEGGGVWLDGISQLVGDWSVGQAEYPAAIQLNSLNQVYDGAPKAVQAVTTPAGLNVGIGYTGTNGTLYGPSANPPVNAGTYNIQATIEDAIYTGYITETLTIAKANQTISFGALADMTYEDADFSVTASANSGLPVRFSVGSQDACTISGSTLHLGGVGSCTVTAEQVGNQNYNPAQPVSRSLTIGKASAAIVLDDLNQLYTGDPKPLSVRTSPTGLRYVVTYQGETYGPTSEPPSLPGSYMVYVEIEDTNYRGAASGTLVIVRPSVFLPMINK